jgi:hypothetical protein
VTLSREPAAFACASMIDRTAYRELGKIAEKWRDLAERRRDHLSELYRTRRWRLYYEQDEFLALVREVAEICDRWAKVVEEHHQVLTGPEVLGFDRDAA